jgi:exonuclease III
LFETTREKHLDFISILESKRNEFTTQELSHLCTEKKISWSWTAPRGRSGGILVGLNLDCFNIDQIIHGNFFMKFKLQNICDNFTWIFIAIYGPAQEEVKYSFLQELTQACNTETSPILIGGDFNIIRNQREKNNDRYEDR